MRKLSVKELVLKFQKGYVNRRVLISGLTPLIMTIPKYFKVYDKDIVQEFYCLIIQDIEKIISKYKSYDSCKFETWFILVAKWRLIDIIRQEKSRVSKLDANSFDLDYLMDSSEEKIKDDSVDLTRFSPMERRIIKEKYLPDIFHNFQNNNIEEILTRLEKKRSLEDKISWYYQRILNIHNKVLALRKDNKDINLDSLKNKERKLYTLKEKLERQYHNFKVCSSNLQIAEQLKLDKGTVSTYTNRIKKKLKKKFPKLQIE
ncbi:MAG: hypothetical protein MJB14_11255 [Spirochaetes bacterium]|nr:hypothetical protein [Spirochaetota bacterium]